MDSAPWGTRAVAGYSLTKRKIHRLWGPHKNRAPPSVPRITAAVNAS